MDLGRFSSSRKASGKREVIFPSCLFVCLFVFNLELIHYPGTCNPTNRELKSYLFQELGFFFPTFLFFLVNN